MASATLAGVFAHPHFEDWKMEAQRETEGLIQGFTAINGSLGVGTD